MSYDPALATARDRVRFLVWDTTEPEILPDATYEAQLTLNSDDEAKTAAAIAGVLLLTVPVKLSDQGTSIDNSALHERWRSLITAQPANSGVMRTRLAERGDRQPLAEYYRESRW